MEEFNVGDRVKDSGLLGEGEVTEVIKSTLTSKVIIGYMVRFDKTPPIRYNRGENPTFMLSIEVSPC